jgi:hypothetical protein
MITVLIFVLIVYFSFSGLLIYRRFFKRISTSVDLSPQIFSPTLRLSRHILRRMWMDTWSALILCHAQMKMPAAQHVAFSLGGDRPPYILSFSGSIAERHVENLKVMRVVGGRRYRDACRDLTPDEVLLRQKVYNFFSGPGITLRSKLKRLFLLAYGQER